MAKSTASRAPKPPNVVPGPLELAYFDEPLLAFGGDGLHVDPKAGIARYGPRSFRESRHPATVRVGIIGTGQTVEQSHRWLSECAVGVPGTETTPRFPGFRRDRGFFSDLSFDSAANETLRQSEINEILQRGLRQKDRFELLLSTISEKLKLVAERDRPPEYVVLALPTDVVKKCRVAEYNDPELGLVHRDLRRAVKVAAMRFRLPTQLVNESTVLGTDPTPAARIAWNFMSGLYFKAGGVPWSPTGLRPATCYIGISFFRPLGTRGPRLQTALVQAFDEHGDGLVLRGHEFEWDPSKQGTASPHLSAEEAERLVSTVLDRYEAEMKQKPRRVIVHKRSRYWEAERQGFKEALNGRVSEFDLLALARQSDVRLIPTNQYPPLRGTRFRLGELDYLYTVGYIADLAEYHGVHVPTPLQIADHVGQDTSRDDLLRDVLVLTKMNWNSSHLGGLMPITLRFSGLVGDILREMSSEQEPLPQFKFYM